MSGGGTIYCVFSKSRPATDDCELWLHAVVPRTFPPPRCGWWTNLSGGVAIHAPGAQRGRGAGASVIAVSGGAAQTKKLCDELLRPAAIALISLPAACSAIIWDGVRKELVLARDKFGQAALYVRELPDRFLCSSDFAPLLAAAPGCSLDVESSIRYLFVGQPVNGRTLAAEVRKVRAAHALHWRPGAALISRRYYSPLRHDAPDLPNRVQRQEIQRALDTAIASSIDGQHGALLLSGGVDSSYIAATVAARGTGTLDAYTAAFEGLTDASEVEHAAAVARKFGLRHSTITLGVSDAVRHLEHILDAVEPCSAWSTLTHRHVAEAISGRHSRVLSGLGADEVFGGYAAYLRRYAAFRRQECEWTSAAGMPKFSAVLCDPAEMEALLFSGVPRFFDLPDLRRALHPPFCRWNPLLPDAAFYRELLNLKSDCHYFEMMIAHECQHRIPELLFCGFEPISRGFDLQICYPFLSPDVVEHVITLRASLRFRPHGRSWKNKLLLRQFAADRLARRTLSRPPVSYNAPILSWLGQHQFARVVLERLHSSLFLDLGIVKKTWLDRLQAGILGCLRHDSAREPAIMSQLWSLLTLSAWHERWLQRPSHD